MEASSWRQHEGAVAGVDYPSQPPAEWGWGGSDFGRGNSSSITMADGARQGAWNDFERRPISRAEARALQELRMSRSMPGRTRSREMGTFASLCSSESSTAKSLATTGDDASLISSVAENGSEMSIATVSSSVPDPFSNGYVRGSENITGIISTTAPLRGDRPKPRRRSRSAIVESRSRENFSTSASHQQRLSPRCDDSGSATSKSDLSGDERQNASISRKGTAHDRDQDAENGLPTAATPAQEATRRLRAPGLRAGKDRRKEHSVAPSSGFELGTGLGAASESVFRLTGEADADDVLRAMVRLSSASTGSGIGQDGREAQHLTRHHRDGDSTFSPQARAHKLTASSGCTSDKAPAEAESRLLSSAERGNGSIFRGSTPAVRGCQRGGEQTPSRKVGNSPPELQDKQLDIEGRTLRSEEGSHKRGSSRSRRTGTTPTCGVPLSGTNKRHSGRSSAPRQGRRHRSIRDATVAEGPGQKKMFLSESRSAPSMASQQEREWSSASSLRGGSAGGGGLAGGRISEESLMQTLSSSALALNSVTSRSNAVSLTSGASQQLRPLTSIDTSLGGDGFESSDPATRSFRRRNSDDNRRHSSSNPGLATATESRRCSARQDQRQPLGTRPLKGQGQVGAPAVGGDGSSKPCESQGETVHSGSVAQGEEAKPAHLSLGQDSSLTTGDGEGGDDGEDGDDGDDKTTGEQMSVIIAGVTRDAAKSVFSSGGTGQPLSPIKSISETAAGSAASPTVSTREPHAPSMPATNKRPLTECPANESTAENGRAYNKSKSKAKSAKSIFSVKDESAAKETNAVTELGAAGAAQEQRNVHGFRSKVSGSSSAVIPPSVASSCGPLQNTSKAGSTKSSSPQPREGGIADGRDGGNEARVAQEVANKTSSAELQKDASRSRGDGLKDVGSGDAPSPAESAKDGKNEAKSFATAGNDPPRTTHSLEPKSTAKGESSDGQATEVREELDKLHGDAGRSVRVAGVPKNGNGGRTIASDGSSPNSLGSSMSSRGSARSNTHVRRTRSNQKVGHTTGSVKNGSTSRGGMRTNKAQVPGEMDASSTEVALPAVARPEAATGTSRGALQEDMHQRHSHVSERKSGGAVNKSPENADGNKLPRMSGAAAASGGRTKNNGGAAEKSSQSAIKVHTRPAKVEDRDLQTTTEALTTHHLAVEELLKVQLLSPEGVSCWQCKVPRRLNGIYWSRTAIAGKADGQTCRHTVPFFPVRRIPDRHPCQTQNK